MDRFIGKRLDGRYEIHELLGTGGMAYVYRAYDKVDDRWVAVKILKEEFSENSDFLRRFRNESKAIAVLSHPNIVKVYDVSFGDMLQYIVMEYINGITLKDYIDQQGVLKVNETLHFAIQILRALEHAHEKGIIHRDIKPQNILLLQDGTIKVTDFGIARFLQSETQTMTDKAIGSVHYISPEQAKGDYITDKADIYSFGVMLYEMITGRLPFNADSAVSVALMQIQTRPRHPSEVNPSVPRGLEQITLKAMEKNPDNRFYSARDMLLDIESFRQNPHIIFRYDRPETPKYNPADAMESYDRFRTAPVYNDNYEYEEELVRSRKRQKGSMAITGVIIALVIVGLAIGIVYFMDMYKNMSDPEDDNITVPNFLGLSYEDDIQNNPEYEEKFTINIIEGNDPEKESGVIIRQNPAAGITVKKGREIDLTVNGAIEKVDVPELTDYDQADAVETLRAMNLKSKIESIPDDDVEVGRVIRTDPAAGETVSAGTIVTLYVSKGQSKKMVTVPNNLVGDLLYNVTAKLQDMNLVVGNIIYDDNSTEAKDTVIAANPLPGEKISEGSSVDLTVSSGKGSPKTVEIYVPMPTNVNADVVVKVYQNATLISTETVNPAYLSNYRISLTGTSGTDRVVMQINDQEYAYINFDYDNNTATITQQFTFVPPVVSEPSQEPENDEETEGEG